MLHIAVAAGEGSHRPLAAVADTLLLLVVERIHLEDGRCTHRGGDPMVVGGVHNQAVDKVVAVVRMLQLVVAVGTAAVVGTVVAAGRIQVVGDTEVGRKTYYHDQSSDQFKQFQKGRQVSYYATPIVD